MGPDEPAEPQAGERLSDWVVRACPDGLWVLDDDGHTTFANEQMAKMLGVDHDETVGLSVYDVLGDSDTSIFRRHLAMLRDTGSSGADLELGLRRSDDVNIWVVASASALTDGSGERRGWLHRVRDNTEQRGSREQWERREAQFTRAQRSAQLGSWEIDVVNGQRLTWSDQLFRTYGVDPATFVPSCEAFIARVHHDDREQVVARIARAYAGQEPAPFDFRFVPDAGEPRWMRDRATVWHDEAGEVIRIGGTVQDITVSKENENALAFLSVMGRAANEARTLQEVLIAAGTFVRPFAQWPAIVFSVPHKRGSEHLFHIDVDWEPASEEQRRAARALSSRVADERRTLEVLGPDGTVLISGPVMGGGELAGVLVSDTCRSCAPSPAERDLFGQILSLLTHVAEREWAGSQLAVARDQALSASTAKSQFLATMSHEIRTPLNGVIGLSELLSSTDLTPHQRRLASGVDQAGRTLLALVNDILDLSKIEAGRLDLEEVDFDPRTIIEQSAGLVANQAREKHLELVISSAGDVPDQVRGDPVRFGQVITNLAANAVKFTRSGEVVIRATCTPGPEGVQLRVEVSDTGVGITQGVEGQLFQPFSQADSSTTREYGGTGLGLAISKRIVMAMKGEIGVDSEVGVGSTFWFTAMLGVPLHDGPGRDSTRENAVIGLRVLIVDDNETNRFILTEKLAAWQVSVKAVDSAYEALVELDIATRSNAPYDIVLLDYMMSGADGEQLARIIRAESRHDGTRLVLLSSAMEPSEEFLSGAGIDTFLSKPVLPAQLLGTLAVLGGRLGQDDDQAAPVVDAAQTVARGRILVVEDNPVNQLVAEGVLERIGYSVLLVDNGAAGVAAYAADLHGFDAILMDCQMPVMDGYDATMAIRAMQPNGPRIPIVAMTAAAGTEERERCLSAGMDDFLLKPVDVALLELTLAQWIAAAGDRPVDGSTLAPRGGPVPDPRRSSGPDPSSAPAADPPPGQDVLDRSRLTELLESGAADLALIFRILERFGSRADDAATNMASAVRVGNTDELSRLAHGLRGGAANVGLVRLARLCEVIELNAAAGDLPPAGTLFEIDDEVAAGVEQLESFSRDMVRDAAGAGGSLRRHVSSPSRA